MSSDSSPCCNCNGRRFRREGCITACHKHQYDFNDEGDGFCAYTNSVADLLAYCPNLESLHLHHFDSSSDVAGSDQQTLAFERLALKTKLPKLKECKLLLKR